MGWTSPEYARLREAMLRDQRARLQRRLRVANRIEVCVALGLVCLVGAMVGVLLWMGY